MPSEMWDVTFFAEPNESTNPFSLGRPLSREAKTPEETAHDTLSDLGSSHTVSSLVQCTCEAQNLFVQNESNAGVLPQNADLRLFNLSPILNQSGRCGRVALADYLCRIFRAHFHPMDHEGTKNKPRVRLEPLGQTMERSSSSVHNQRSRRRQRPNPMQQSSLTPYILERSDCVCSENNTIEIWAQASSLDMTSDSQTTIKLGLGDKAPNDKNERSVTSSQHQESFEKDSIRSQINEILCHWIQTKFDLNNAMTHIAVAVVQDLLRQELKGPRVDGDGTNMNNDRAVAFVANHAILPRKNGAIQAPMASPPAVPFMAPGADSNSSPMHRTISVSIPSVFVPYLPSEMISTRGIKDATKSNGDLKESQQTLAVNASLNGRCQVSVTGLWIPCGVSLVVGGGYHGKVRSIRVGVSRRDYFSRRFSLQSFVSSSLYSVLAVDFVAYHCDRGIQQDTWRWSRILCYRRRCSDYSCGGWSLR